MSGGRSLLLVLLALSTELPPAPAQQHRTRHRGAAPTATAAPRRAPRVWRPPGALRAPGKAGECPAGGSGAPLAPGLYCLWDRGCPGAERCCRRGPVRTCVLPSTGSPLPGTRPHAASPPAESPGYCPRPGSAGGGSCATSCRNDAACSPGEKRCSRGCCARCLRAEPAKAGLCPRKRVRRSAAACSNRCADDRDCPGNRKCCFSGCGLACASPDRGSRHAAAKPGTCPVVLRGSLGPCLELCDTDSDCPGTAKCCTTGCGHICKPPTEGPGLSPRAEVLPAGLRPDLRPSAARHSLALAGKGCTRSWVPEPLSSHPVGEKRAAAAPSTSCPSPVPAPDPLHCQPIAPALL
ncbi:WAP four-disulfide core domain protein 3-like [Pezoporus occidentalis]|uniref:WAP four-disulfide core domain protein 3-like n=1 Tax=Pezoporus occidentalis TaxID=407982 RepID=UPI002F9120F5